ncbi:MAG: L,D-transpeptidase, partial [Polyangiaceae bacterium]|nr:L,D-transpeptidase [Polyangiaceae bacterium]
SAGVYRQPRAIRSEKLGYVKLGGKVPVLAEKVKGKDCSKGWYAVKGGGYICSSVGSTDPKSKTARFAPSQPNVSEILPYQYARNAQNGTPAYRSLPNSDQLCDYEPFLKECVEKKKTLDARKEAIRQEREADLAQMREQGLAVGGAPPTEGLDDEPVEEAVPLWERTEDLNELKITDLREGADGMLAGRLMKGFYVAIDKEFEWKNRKYFKTTKSVMVPANRFWKTSPSDFQGLEIDGEEWKIPVAWVAGPRKFAPTYEINVETNAVKAKGSLKKFTPIQLNGEHHKIGTKDYFQTKDGLWVRDPHTRTAKPGPRPDEVGDDEVWLDVDISEQTVVVLRGDTPIYATLISSGRHSNDEEKDHSTPRGMWRVREKHMASTMDGDGSAAGDLPYSIEDVPYIMYFYKSYATHAAFWHRNYGSQMSHGCVNLSPLDAKKIFFLASPALPEGLHGVWSGDDNPGSWVVVHD